MRKKYRQYRSVEIKQYELSNSLLKNKKKNNNAHNAKNAYNSASFCFKSATGHCSHNPPGTLHHIRVWEIFLNSTKCLHLINNPTNCLYSITLSSRKTPTHILSTISIDGNSIDDAEQCRSATRQRFTYAWNTPIEMNFIESTSQIALVVILFERSFTASFWRVWRKNIATRTFSTFKRPALRNWIRHKLPKLAFPQKKNIRKNKLFTNI